MRYVALRLMTWSRFQTEIAITCQLNIDHLLEAFSFRSLNLRQECEPEAVAWFNYTSFLPAHVFYANFLILCFPRA